MSERLIEVVRTCGWLGLLFAAGAAGDMLMIAAFPVPPQHGVVAGVALGAAFLAGVIIANVTVWIVTGHSVMDRVMGLDP